ncbi:hydroxyacid dehydrogenase [Paracoccus laeviglucosivorans]|uniref:hydroxyacid dehydrogenase n=1 Tax=Paracoccus laeviglucosivorans TaxID=1197861 RepID=UPI001FE9CB2D|nr:hydroxyacid dehydrogenase [Paracoccus laeviglucosivorans]
MAPEAEAVLVDAGYLPVYLPPYTEGDGLNEIAQKTKPVGVLVRMGRIDDSFFDAAPEVRVISKHGAGVDNIDVNAASARGIFVLNAAGANAVSVAEHAIALLLAVAKKIGPLDKSVREGRWEKSGFQGRELAGSTIGLVAFGAIARQMARFAKAFDIRVRAYDPFSADDVFDQEGVERVQSLDELFATCDIISLHSPLTPETSNLVNAERLAAMKPGGIIINTARGGLIDEAALQAALESGHLAGAGLDTFAQEPPPAEHPFWQNPRLVLTPHIAGVTTAAGTRVGIDAAQGIVDFLAGKSLPAVRIVNRNQLNIPA